MQIYVTETANHLHLLKERFHQGYLIEFVKIKDLPLYVPAANDTLLITKFNSNNELKEILPSPFNKKTFSKLLVEGVVVQTLEQRNSHLTLYVGVDNLDGKYTNDNVKEFVQHMLYPKTGNTYRVYLDHSQHTKFKTDEFCSKTGMEKSRDNVLTQTAYKLQKEIQDHPDMKNLFTQHDILNPDVDANDYTSYLHMLIADAEKDFELMKAAFEQGTFISSKIYGVKELKARAKQVQLKYRVSEQKMKSLLGFILEHNAYGITIIDLMESPIPDRYIINRQMPKLNLVEVKIG